MLNIIGTTENNCYKIVGNEQKELYSQNKRGFEEEKTIAMTNCLFTMYLMYFLFFYYIRNYQIAEILMINNMNAYVIINQTK